MRKIALVLVLGMTMVNCTSAVTVEAIDDGQTMRLQDTHGITKRGDTLVVEISPLKRSVYGRYKGNLPKSFVKMGRKVDYKLVKRIK